MAFYIALALFSIATLSYCAVNDKLTPSEAIKTLRGDELREYFERQPEPTDEEFARAEKAYLAVAETHPDLPKVRSKRSLRDGPSRANRHCHWSLTWCRYLFNVPYGVGKEALDRLSADMAVELKKKNVTVVSLWPGHVKTELVKQLFLNDDGSPKNSNPNSKVFAEGESVEFAGKAIVALAADTRRHQKSGRTLLTADLGNQYSFADVDGSQPWSFRSLSRLMAIQGYKRTANFVPSWVMLPGWLLWAKSSRL